jgi:hypothetical protein
VASVCWDAEGSIHVEYRPQGKIISQNARWDWLRQLREKIQRKRPAYLPPSVMVQLDNADPLNSSQRERFVVVVVL